MLSPLLRKGEPLHATDFLLSGLSKRLYQARLDLSAREGRRISQAEIAAIVGVHQVTLGEWERGKSEPNLDTIERLADIYGRSAAYLAFGTEASSTTSPGRVPAAAGGG